MNNSLHKKVAIFTDGSSLGNPGNGGYAAVLVYKGHEKEIFGCEKNTTNNRMELRAVIEALSVLKEPVEVDIYSDSSYVVNGINEWLEGWILKGFNKVKNVDLWRRYIEVAKRHVVNIKHVKGHTGITLNERCDVLAKHAAKNCGNHTTIKAPEKAGANIPKYINYTGRRSGADGEWAEIGEKYGFIHHIFFSTSDYDNRSDEKKIIIEKAYKESLKILNRKFFSRFTVVGKLMRRSYLQAANAEGIYAISQLVSPNQVDYRGFTSRAARTTVAGGTAYAVEYGIMLHRKVYVFDQFKKTWYKWDYHTNRFTQTDVPVLRHKYAGIGTRAINDAGRKAIEAVYAKTIAKTKNQYK